ncbi:hypothetical protein GCM10025784_24950 [Citricoccus nitrophenolicus]
MPQRVTEAIRTTAVPGAGAGAGTPRYSMVRRLEVTAAVAVEGVVEGVVGLI